MLLLFMPIGAYEAVKGWQIGVAEPVWLIAGAALQLATCVLVFRGYRQKLISPLQPGILKRISSNSVLSYIFILTALTLALGNFTFSINTHAIGHKAGLAVFGICLTILGCSIIFERTRSSKK